VSQPAVASVRAPRWLAANPAVELMARLSYPKKIQMVGLVAAIAILLLTGQLFFSLSGQIERASLERTGLSLVQPVRQVLEPLQQHRGLMNAWVSGDDDYRAQHADLLKPALRRRTAQVDTAFVAADAAFRKHLPALADDPRWLSARKLWAEIRGDAAPHSASVLERHNEAIAALNGVISSAADATHLSVDPYVGTFYLAQLVVRQLPGVIEQASKIRDIGAGVYASRELDRDAKFLVISLNTMAGDGLAEARATVDGKVLATMPGLKDRLVDDAERFAGIAQSVDTFTSLKLLGKLFDSPPEAFFAGMTFADRPTLDTFRVGARDLALDSGEAILPGPIGDLYATLDRYSEVLDNTINDRLWRLRQQLALNLLVAFAALVVVIYMLYVMYVSFPIRKLIAATEQVAAGNLDTRLEIERNDEIGQLARAFNSMTEAVKYTQNNLEHLVAERTAELSDKNHMIMESINYARVIQSSFLRASRQDMATTLDDYFMIWEPRDVVGGDYLFFRRFDDGYFFAVIDCTGHGVPGAFMTLIMASYLNNLLTSANRHDPAALLGRMNRAVKQALGQFEGVVHQTEHQDDGHASDDGMDAAFVWVDSDSHTLTYAGAKTPLFYLPTDGDAVQALEGERRGVGYVDTPEDFAWQNQVLPLEPGMSIYVTTDGIIDQIGETKRMAFGKRRLHQAIVAAADLPMAEQQPAIYDAYLAHQGSEARRDDVSMFAFRYQ
jgi:serine phosphatase RsbU (regulator of sigma subunit)